MSGDSCGTLCVWGLLERLGLGITGVNQSPHAIMVVLDPNDSRIGQRGGQVQWIASGHFGLVDRSPWR